MDDIRGSMPTTARWSLRLSRDAVIRKSLRQTGMHLRGIAGGSWSLELPY